MIGLVLAGGNSTRMGEDKAELYYHSQPQYFHLKNLLSPYCSEVFISSKSNSYSCLPMIFDDKKYGEIGPIAGLLTAFDQGENEDILVISVDSPLISDKEIKQLIQSKNNLASVFYNPETNFYEPFLGVYRANFKLILQENFEQNNISLQQILKENNVEKIIPDNLDVIKSINTKAEYNYIILKYFTK